MIFFPGGWFSLEVFNFFFIWKSFRLDSQKTLPYPYQVTVKIPFWQVYSVICSASYQPGMGLVPSVRRGWSRFCWFHSARRAKLLWICADEKLRSHHVVHCCPPVCLNIMNTALHPCDLVAPPFPSYLTYDNFTSIKISFCMISLIECGFILYFPFKIVTGICKPPILLIGRKLPFLCVYAFLCIPITCILSQYFSFCMQPIK